MNCPYCRSAIEPDPHAQKICEGCATPHHVECFQENGGCTLFGCKFAPPDEPKVEVRTMEVARAVALTGTASPAFAPQRTFTGFGDVQAPVLMRPAAPVVAPDTIAPPPPPPFATSTSAPPPLAMAAAVSAQAPAVATASAPRPEPQRFITPGGIFDSVPDASGNLVASRQPKHRHIYILLGLGLGILGAHNFYAGYRKMAIIQLCLTVLTLFFAAPITAIWALVEICTIDRDSQSVEFD